jgi:hypothetical protein
MASTKTTARLTGWVYLGVVISGLFVLMYVPGRLFVPDNAAATVSNIVAHQTLFRSYILVGVVAELLFVTVVLMLYRLLKDVNRVQAAVMVLLVLLMAPLAFLSSMNQVATLAFARGDALLNVFDKPQRDALAALLLTIDVQGTVIAEIFWGLWLLPLGMLVFRSGFLPRFLGVWLIINGLAYVVISMTGLLLPQYVHTVFLIAQPALMGELVLTLWLLIVGARVHPPARSQAEVAV